MDNLQEFFVVCMAICFALSTSYAFASVMNLQEQSQNDYETLSNVALLVDTIGLFQMSVGTDRMEEFRQDYLNAVEQYGRVGWENYKKNKILKEEFEVQSKKTFWFLIFGFLFFILHLRFFKKIINFFKGKRKNELF